MRHRAAARVASLRARRLTYVETPARGFPIEVPTPDNLYDVERRTRCKTHSECLTYAQRKDWAGMSCEHCDIRDEHPQGGDVDRDQMIGLAELLVAIRTDGHIAYRKALRVIEEECNPPTRAEMRAIKAPGVQFSYLPKKRLS